MGIQDPSTTKDEASYRNSVIGQALIPPILKLK